MNDTHLSPMSHPTEEQLLLLLDGELPSREASDIQAHLQLCWECRGKSQKLQNGIYAFVNYMQECFLPKVGEPPQGWRGFGPWISCCKLRTDVASDIESGLMTTGEHFPIRCAITYAVVFSIQPIVQRVRG